MRFRWRSIRGQIVASFLLFELIAVVMFSGLLIRERRLVDASRTVHRLEAQSAAVAPLCGSALAANDPGHLEIIASSILQLATIDRITVTTPGGLVLASGDPKLIGSVQRTAWDSILPHLRDTVMLRSQGRMHGSVSPIRVRGRVAAYLWLTPSPAAMASHIGYILRVTLWGALAVLIVCALMAGLIARSLSRPLTRLLGAMRRMTRDPQDTGAFPLEVTREDEMGDLIGACNRMVAAIGEQREGLNHTLALLDSMLAHAPIGVAFFDRGGVVVRVNQFLAALHGEPVSFYLGQALEDVFAPRAARRLRRAVREVFEKKTAVLDFEVCDPGREGAPSPELDKPVTWQVSIYPVRSPNEGVRWAGALIVDISGRLRAEEALRKSEKLAAAGRLAASIAHEINNPLEAVTNLLYLLDNYAELAPDARGWVTSAQHEVARVSAITQQTLRFYRQSTRPAETSLTELLDSVLTLYQGRVNGLQVRVVRVYRDEALLMCLGGELRQLFANLAGNALDAMQPGPGRLILRARAATDVRQEGGSGVRVTVADTGSGMSPEVRRRIFEPFFTTKEVTGTGLGLWVGSEIMNKHGVRWRVRSRERTPERAGGTVFSLFFPAGAVVDGSARSAAVAAVGVG